MGLNMAAACPSDGFNQRMETISTALSPNSNWYALQVRPRYEKTSATLLAQKGYQELLPLQRVSRRWSDRIAAVDLPLFPGYVFCQFDPQDRRMPIMSTPGVLQIVGIGKLPQALEQSEVAALRTIMEAGVAAEPCAYLPTGSRVRVEAGSLAGIEGIVVEHKKKQRLVISVSLLQRSVSVEIDSAWLTPLAKPFRAAGYRSTACA